MGIRMRVTGRALLTVTAVLAIALPRVLQAGEAVPTSKLVKLPRMEFESQYGPQHRKYTFAPGFQLPKEAMVYKVKTKPVTEQRMRGLIKLFDMPDPGTLPKPSVSARIHAGSRNNLIWIAADGSEGSYNIWDRHESLYVGSDGTITYSSEPPSEVQAPSEKESVEIAKAFLARSGFIPPDAELQIFAVNGSGVQAAYDDGTYGPDIMEERTPSFWIIRRDEVLERSMVDVSICAGGKICGLVLCMREIEPYAVYPLKSLKEVTADLKAMRIGEGEPDSYFAIDEPRDITIETCRLVYKDPGLNRYQYIQPILCLIGKKTTGRGVTKPFVCSVAAVKPEYTVAERKPDPMGSLP